MKRVLLDENVDILAHKIFADYAAKTVSYMKWNGVSNGKLLSLADTEFDVMITADKNIPYQQSLANRRISVIVVPSGRLDRIETIAAQIKDIINNIAPATYHVM
jgi:hypothetical protein